MGSTFENCHVRAVDAAPVIAALREGPAPVVGYVTPSPHNGWVSVFAADEVNKPGLAKFLSARLETATLYFWEYDSDACGYVLYEGGEQKDIFDSNPDLWVGEVDENGSEIQPKTDEERGELAGSPWLLRVYCVAGTTEDDIRAALGTTGNDANASLFAEVAAFTGVSQAEVRDAYLARVDTILDRTRAAFGARAGSPFTLGAGTSARNLMTMPDADGIVHSLARLLGLDDRVAGLRYRDIERGYASEIGLALARI